MMMQSLDASQRGGGSTAACLATGVGIRQCLSRRRLIEYLLANGAGARVDPRIVGPCRASLNVKFGGCHSNNSIRPINLSAVVFSADVPFISSQDATTAACFQRSTLWR